LLKAKNREAKEDHIRLAGRSESLENFLIMKFLTDRGSLGSREERVWEGKLGRKLRKEGVTHRGGSVERRGSCVSKQGKEGEENPSGKRPSCTI